MPALYLITFSDRPDEPVQWSYPEGYSYPYPNEESEFTVHVTVGWCEACEGLVAVENFENAEELRNDYVRLSDRTSPEAKEASNLSAKIGMPPNPEQDEEYYAARLEEARLRLAFREARKSSPRCLHCGTTRSLPSKKPA